jgi:hypothetical protein
MRLLIKLLLTAGMVFALSSQANAFSVDLVQTGGPATPNPSDVISFNIEVTLLGGEATTLVDPAIGLIGASFVGGTEAAYNFVGGVLLTPIGSPNTDIGTINGGLAAAGWEGSTLTPGGAPGPAVFVLGTAVFHVNSTTVALEFDAPTALGVPFGTVIGDGAFMEIQNSVSYGNFYSVPEPTTAGLMILGVVGLAVAGRRR